MTQNQNQVLIVEDTEPPVPPTIPPPRIFIIEQSPILRPAPEVIVIMQQQPLPIQPQIIQIQQSPSPQPRKLTSNPFTIITAKTLLKKEQTKCQNQSCKSQGIKVLKVSDAGPYNYLCELCNERFKDHEYCCYCHQIYFQYADGTDWIMCDKCQKWIHTDCEQKLGDSNIKVKMSKNTDLVYYCPKCKPLKSMPMKKMSSIPSREQKQYKDSFKDKNKFVKRVDCILNGYGFYWKLKPEEIQADLEKMRRF